jgi:CrcB protein
VTLLWVALAGAAGAVARFVVDGAVRHRWAPTFPWATLAINVSGSLLLGLVTGAVLFAGAPDLLHAVVGVGLCGGYTTFSTTSFETVRLAQQGRAAAALANALGSLVASVAAATAGLGTAATIW